MFKKLFLLLTLSAAFTAKSQITNPAPYCACTYFSGYNMFKDITIGGVTLSFGSLGTYGTANTYKYFNTTVFGDLTKSGNNTITINPYTTPDFEPIYFALWIDYDHSNTFETSEIVLQNSNTINAALPAFSETAVPLTRTFTVPGTALTGTTRARLVRTQASYPYSSSVVLSPCSNGSFGSFGNPYDFNVNIVTSLSTAETAVKNSFRIYPNPAQDFIMIDTSRKITQATLFSTEGKQVKSYPGANRLDVSSLQPGEYILEVYYKDGTSASQKVLIAK